MTSKPKAWNPVYLAVMAFFLTIIPAAFLCGLNMKRMGKPKWFYPIILAAIILFGFELYLTAVVKENQVWMIQVYHLSLALAVSIPQKKLYEKQLDDELIEEASFTKPILGGIVFVAIMLSSYYGWLFIQHRQLNAKMGSAMEDYNQGDYENARKKIMEIKKDYGDYAEVYYNLAITLDRENKTDSAILIMKEWLEIAPNDSAAKELLFQLNYSTGNE